MRAKKRSTTIVANLAGSLPAVSDPFDTEHADDLILEVFAVAGSGDLDVQVNAHARESDANLPIEGATVSLSGVTSPRAVRIPGPFSQVTTLSFSGTYTAVVTTVTVVSVSHGSVAQ